MSNALFLAVVFAVVLTAAFSVACRRSPATPLTEEALRSSVVIDVRTAGEHAAGHLAGDHLIPVDEIDARAADVVALVNGDKQRHVVVYCKSGGRSSRAKALLEKHGFTHVDNGGGYDDLVARFPALQAR